VYARATAEPQTGSAATYAQFRAAVARAQIVAWLPSAKGATLIDISGPGANAADLASGAGHNVLRVIPPMAVDPADQIPGASRQPAAIRPVPDQPVPSQPAPGQLPPDRPEPGQLPPDRPEPGQQRGSGVRLVIGDECRLEFLADGCADGVIAEDRTLSVNLAAEALVAEIARVLRPRGRVLACVDSLMLGMAALAQQSRWPHLMDVPHADVVLVPWPDDTITRCYGAEHLRELFTAGGLEVNWIRPRTVFAQQTVTYLLARDPASFPRLVSAELRSRADDSVGDQLVISATKR
jgi:SAM-dependent methyltransferase